ncbi:MAG: bifunctional phosphoribosylaminoimidazolecarboxamide formyltransferase/IMP cyclohydrolase [Thermoanaerobaculia bacterium]
MLKAQRALVSVSDKTGLVEFARGLARAGVEILSTGGTFRALEEAGVRATPVAEVTGFPEILDGRVKTLHPAIHGGILADRDRAAHLTQLEQHGIRPIDIVVVNLYPFRETAAKAGKSRDDVVEMIDIGGPCMVRAAAKNASGVVVVVDPRDYPQVLAALEANDGVVPPGLRRRLAAKAFRHTQSYDAAIAGWLEHQEEPDGEARFPYHHFVDLERNVEPRYGENPHQAAAVYQTLGGPGLLGGFEQLQGKALSWNNLLDADAARKLVSQVETPAVAIIKHNNPCGVGVGESQVEAYERALACDPVSAFGSIIAVTRPVRAELAERLGELFVEVLIAPEFEEAALEQLAARPSLRLLRAPLYAPRTPPVELRAIDGGFLAQEADALPDPPESWECPTARQPTDEERRALAFAWCVARYVKSNAIVVANEVQTVGIGAGQMSRVDACELALRKAELPLAGTVAASDAFFPFRDGLDVLAGAGVRAVVQPGGSKRDAEVVEAADEHGIAMLFTGRRHFRH